MSTSGRAFALVGPTASGKSALAIGLAEASAVEIVNLDAMQIFRGLDIGTAKPTADERLRVPHHLYDIREPDEPLGAGAYAELARHCVDEVGGRGAISLLAGGSAFYLRVLREGLSPIPDIDPAVRDALRRRLDDEGLEPLRAELESTDPAWAARVHPNDRQRIIRGLEVAHATGRTLSSFQQEPRRRVFAHTLTVFVVDPGPALDERITARAGAMLEGGLVEEVENLLGAGLDRRAHGLNAPGYREVVAHLDGELAAGDLPAALATAHRRYARRQRTFLRGERDLVAVTSVAELAAAVGRG